MRLVFPPLYAILDASLSKASELSVFRELMESGVELLQYRDKSGTARECYELCLSLSSAAAAFSKTSSRPIRFITNDRPDIALLCGASGVHVGQHDLGVEQARAIVGPDRWVGVSTHTMEQVDAAEQTSADYVAFGPIFATSTKDRPDPVVGLTGLAEARKRTSKPLVAIGGITLERASETYAAGADSLAVARDLVSIGNIRTRVQAFLDVTRAGRKS